MTALWIAAAIMAFVTFMVHTFVCTRFAVPALIAAGDRLAKATIWLNYMCWHIVTGVLFILAATMVAVALGQLQAGALLPAGLSLAWIACMSVITTTKAGIPLLRFPASYLAGATALLALAGALL